MFPVSVGICAVYKLLGDFTFWISLSLSLMTERKA